MGASNVFWVLILTASTYDAGVADLYYPGRSYVNFLGADGYNWRWAHRQARWRSFADIFTSFYFYSVEKHLPAMITETGTLEDPTNPGRKAAWLQGAEGWLQTHPNIKAFIYFNTTVQWPWWIDTSPQSLAAFRTLANDPLFRNPMNIP
jgi:beta-mannanase